MAMTSRLLLAPASIVQDRGALQSLAAVAWVCGIAAALLAGPVVGLGSIVPALAAVVAMPVALSKTATACGVNALGSFSQYDRNIARRLGGALLYALTATATAAIIGSILGTIGRVAGLGWLIPILSPLCLLAGLKELGLVRGRQIPASLWQVPAGWVRREAVAPVVWGLFLGSGSATQMPHPTYYALLALAALLPMPQGAVLLGVYGLTRSTPAVAAAVSGHCSGQAVVSRLFELRLLAHLTNGLAAIGLAGALGAVTALRWLS